MIALTPSHNFHLLLLVASLFFLFLFPFAFSFSVQLSRLLWHFVCVIVAERSLYRSNKQSKQTQRRRFIGHAWLGNLLVALLAVPPAHSSACGCVHRRRPRRVGYIYGVYYQLQLSSQKPKHISGELPRYYKKSASPTKLCLHFYY